MDTEELEQQSANPIGTNTESVKTPILLPTAKRAFKIFAVFFLLQLLIALVMFFIIGIYYGVTGGDPNDVDGITTFIEGYVGLIGIVASFFSAICIVLWLWQRIRDPADGFSFQFIGLVKCAPSVLALPAGVGAGIGICYLVFAALMFPITEDSGMGPMTTMAMTSNWNLVLWVCTALLLAPFLEELLFRGILLKCFLQSWPTPPASYLAISMTVLLFTALHFQEFIYYPIAAIAIVSMAGSATYFRLKTDTLAAASAVHFSYNSVMVTAVLIGRTAG